MKFQYIGNGDYSPKITEVYEKTFALNGEHVEVTDLFAITKLKGNPSFRQVYEPALIEAEFTEDVPRETLAAEGEVFVSGLPEDAVELPKRRGRPPR